MLSLPVWKRMPEGPISGVRMSAIFRLNAMSRKAGCTLCGSLMRRTRGAWGVWVGSRS